MLNQEWIRLTEDFLKESFENSLHYRIHPSERAYRLAHSYRVANIGRKIAEAEGFDPTEMMIACLLHDISYCTGFRSSAESIEHGRLSAKLAKPFLEQLGLPRERICDICYGIAIHVDDRADFDGVRTAFAETISDADNIDRFDAYRIYDNLSHIRFHELSLEEKVRKVESVLESLYRLKEWKLVTKTADMLWQDNIAFNISFYERLREQLRNSTITL